MKKRIINRFLIVLIASMGMFTACDEGIDDNFGDKSVKATSPTIAITGVSTADVAEGDVINFTATMSETQLIDVMVYVSVLDASTADASDYSLSGTLTIPAGLLTANGSISFADETDVEADETVVFQVGDDQTANATVTPATATFTIVNTDVVPLPAATVDFTMRWEFTDPAVNGFDACDNDLDMTFQTQGGAGYDDDLLGYSAAVSDCPETGTLTIADMTDGQVYDVWMFIYGANDYGDLSGMTVYLDYERADSDFNGTVEIAGVFDSRMPGNGGKLMTIERNGDVLTLKDGVGNVLGEGRMSQPTLHSVTKHK